MTHAQISSVRPAVTADPMPRTGLDGALLARIAQRLHEQARLDRMLRAVFCGRIASAIFMNIFDARGKDARAEPPPQH